MQNYKTIRKILVQSTLFSTIIMVVYAIAVPPLHLSAKSEPEFDETERVRKGTIVEISPSYERLVIDFNGMSVPVIVNGSTTVTLPNGAETEISFLRDGTAVYVFGYYDLQKKNIEAEKIVMRNRPITQRKESDYTDTKSPRKTDRQRNPSILEELSLTGK